MIAGEVARTDVFGPLAGLRAVEFDFTGAAAYAGWLLSECGMDVTTLAPEERADPYAARAVLDRSKRRLAVRPSHGSTSEIVSVLRTCDLVIVDASQGIARHHGIDFASISALNPAVIYLALPAFEENHQDPEVLAGDAEVAAYGGIMAEQASYDGGPVMLTTPICARSAGILGAAAALDVLRRRAEGSPGECVTVSQLAGTLAIQPDRLITSSNVAETSRWSKRSPLGPFPAVHVYKASDDYFALACLTPPFWHRLCVALDHPEWISDERFETAPLGIPDDSAKDWLVEHLVRIFATRTRDEWLSLLRQADVPAAKVLSREECLVEPQARHSGLAVEIEVPELGRTVQSSPPLSFSRTPARIGRVPASTRPDLAFSAVDVGRVRVVDLAAYIAGTYCPTLLSDLGADVIKVESAEGDPFRLTGLDFVGLNRGKRSIAVDLKSDEGREIVYRLVAEADVVVQNFRPGVAERLGVDYETLSRLNPALVYASISAYGPDGPKSGEPAFDQLMLAQSGIMRAQGAQDGEPVCLTQAVADFGGAMLMTFGIMAALFQRRQSGRGQAVSTSLLRAAVAMQAGEFLFGAPGVRAEQGGVDYRGSDPWRSCYETSDGWLFIDGHAERGQELASTILPGAPALHPHVDHPELRAALAGAITTQSTDDGLSLLRSTGISAQPVKTWEQLLHDEYLWEAGWLDTRTTEGWGEVTQLGNVLRAAGEAPRVAPRLGEHTCEILAEVGYSPTAIERLLHRSVTFQPTV